MSSSNRSQNTTLDATVDNDPNASSFHRVVADRNNNNNNSNSNRLSLSRPSMLGNGAPTPPPLRPLGRGSLLSATTLTADPGMRDNGLSSSGFGVGLRSADYAAGPFPAAGPFAASVDRSVHKQNASYSSLETSIDDTRADIRGMNFPRNQGLPGMKESRVMPIGRGKAPHGD